MEICEKHDKMMERLFEDINNVKITNVEIKTLVGEIKSFKDKLHETMYGNSKPGLLTRTSAMITQLNLQWTLLVLMIGSIIGFALKN